MLSGTKGVLFEIAEWILVKDNRIPHTFSLHAFFFQLILRLNSTQIRAAKPCTNHGLLTKAMF